MSIHDENNATVYKCKNCNKYYTDHFSIEEINKHTSGMCIRTTKVINIKTKEPYDVYCGRQSLAYGLKESLFCNPFVIGRDGTREEVINKFKNYFYKRLEEDENFNYEVWKLKGRTLACWCVPEKCHCQVIIDFLDNNHNKVPIKKYKLAVVGSRGITNRPLIFNFLDERKDKIEMIVSGGCENSPDEIANEWCKSRGVPILILYPDWNGKGKSAGFQRNRLIIENANNVVAFHDGVSKGTANSISIAKELGKPCKVITIKKVLNG